MACSYCKKLTHEWYDCKVKPDGWKPKLIRVQDAKALRAEVVATTEPEPAQEAQILRPGPVSAGSPNGRVTGFEPVGAGSTPAPASKFDKTAYQRDYVAKWRRGEVGNKNKGNS